MLELLEREKDELKESIDDNTTYALDLAMEKSASCFTSKTYIFDFGKSDLS